MLDLELCWGPLRCLHYLKGEGNTQVKLHTQWKLIWPFQNDFVTLVVLLALLQTCHVRGVAGTDKRITLGVLLALAVLQMTKRGDTVTKRGD
jgi:hypothetical protein